MPQQPVVTRTGAPSATPQNPYQTGASKSQQPTGMAHRDARIKRTGMTDKKGPATR